MGLADPVHRPASAPCVCTEIRCVVTRPPDACAVQCLLISPTVCQLFTPGPSSLLRRKCALFCLHSFFWSQWHLAQHTRISSFMARPSRSLRLLSATTWCSRSVLPFLHLTRARGWGPHVAIAHQFPFNSAVSAAGSPGSHRLGFCGGGHHCNDDLQWRVLPA